MLVIALACLGVKAKGAPISSSTLSSPGTQREVEDAPADPTLPMPCSPCPAHGLYPCKALCNTSSPFNKLSLERTITKVEHTNVG